MDHCLTIDTIAGALGVSPRWVRVRAKKEQWWTICRRIRGGYRYLFPPAGLPDDVRCAMYADPSACATAGFARGIDVNAEKLAADKTREDAKINGLAAYNALPPDKKAEADARYEVLKARDAFLSATRLPKKKGTLLYIKELKSGSIRLPEDVDSALPRRKGRIALSWATIYRWEKAYTDQGRAGLSGQYVSTATTSVPTHMHAFIHAMLVDRPHISIPNLRKALIGRFHGQALPGDSSLRRYADKWREDNANLILYITDFDQWRSLHMAAAGDASERASALNEIWEFDSTKADVMLTDGRHTLIGVIDVFSRRVKLLVSPTSKAESVAALTRNAILDWGIPVIAKTDNGSDYVSKHMVRVFDDLGIWQELCPPFAPEKKPHIERFFETFSHSIVELLPGYIGHSVADRKAIEARKSFARRMMEKDSAVEISLSSSELQAICERWITVGYHHDPHRSLLGKTPAQVARSFPGPVRRIAPENERALDILLNPAPDNSGLRQVGKKGITVGNVWYNAPEFAGYEGKDVFVLEDRADWSAVYVFSAEYPREYICKAVNAELPSVDRQEIAEKRKSYQKQYYQEASKKLRAMVKKQATGRVFEEYLDARASDIATIVEMPRPSQDYTTPMLEEAALAAADDQIKVLGPMPIEITRTEARQADAVIRLADKQARRTLPYSDWERYEYLTQDLESGKTLDDADLAFMKRYELYLETGKMTGERTV